MKIRHKLREALNHPTSRRRATYQFFDELGHALATKVVLGGQRYILIEATNVNDTMTKRIAARLKSILEATKTPDELHIEDGYDGIDDEIPNENDTTELRDQLRTLFDTELSDLNMSNGVLDISYGYVGGDPSSYNGTSLDQWLASFPTWRKSLRDRESINSTNFVILISSKK